ncbi:unnamed protein product [Lactuca saligna]|uniref:Di19 zinc-binding domain-containing protein n=1 Tax=Lactuca saligna TaxID=75948 RepID=A0AA35ZCQ3_LACSI|nr:unnamed protein product [Lactuca saligna]
MDTNSWTRFSTSNSSLRRYQSRSEETDDEPRPEYLCPFCAEDFDIVGLCCHIDEEHTVQAKNGVCPICAKKVGTEPDPLLSSFIYNNTPDDDVSKDQSHSSTAAVSIVEGSNNDFFTRSEKEKGGIVSGEDKEEKSRQRKRATVM